MQVGPAYRLVVPAAVSTVRGAGSNRKQSMMKSAFRSLFLGLLVAGLAGCGGGGDGTTATSNPAPATNDNSAAQVPAAQSYQSYVDDAGTYTFDVSGTVGTSPVTGSGTLVVNAPAADTFDGAAAERKTLTITGNADVQGGAIVLDDNYNHFFAGGKPVGFTNASEYTVLANVADIPQDLKVGDSGQWYTGTIYTDSTKATEIGTRVVTYSIEDGGNGAALVKIRQQDTSANQRPMVDLTLAFEVQASGAMRWKSLRAVSGDTDLVYTAR